MSVDDTYPMTTQADASISVDLMAVSLVPCMVHLSSICLRLLYSVRTVLMLVLERVHLILNMRRLTGMHSIRERPVVVNGEIVIRPIMVIALTYDHRLLDGREATTFLGTSVLQSQSIFLTTSNLIVKVRDYVQDPLKMLL